MNRIPLVDLKAQYDSIKSEIDYAISSVIEQTAFVRGNEVTQFEQVFADRCGVKHCIGVGNGTDALYIIMKMLGIGVGDEVITTAHSWISTSETISQTGARPVFIDVDEYYTLDTGQLEAHLTPRTKAVLPVHLFGQMCDMDVLVEFCERNNLHLIEDCAQSHFSSFRGRYAGNFGIAGSFSFYPGKNLGAYGDAGAIVTNNDELADRIRKFANHGSLRKHEHELEGINSRLDGIQAAILNVKLKYIGAWTQKRIEIAETYNNRLKDLEFIRTPNVRPQTVHSFHVYCIQTENRDLWIQRLHEVKIDTAIHYPRALPNLPAYKYLGLHSSSFPNASWNETRIMSLPIYPELEASQIDQIISAFEQGL